MPSLPRLHPDPTASAKVSSLLPNRMGKVQGDSKEVAEGRFPTSEDGSEVYTPTAAIDMVALDKLRPCRAPEI